MLLYKRGQKCTKPNLFIETRMKPFLDEVEGHRLLDLLHVLGVFVQLTAILERE